MPFEINDAPGSIMLSKYFFNSSMLFVCPINLIENWCETQLYCHFHDLRFVAEIAKLLALALVASVSQCLLISVSLTSECFKE